jgi:hypothetical protein
MENKATIRKIGDNVIVKSHRRKRKNGVTVVKQHYRAKKNPKKGFSGETLNLAYEKGPSPVRRRTGQNIAARAELSENKSRREASVGELRNALLARKKKKDQHTTYLLGGKKYGNYLAKHVKIR